MTKLYSGILFACSLMLLTSTANAAETKDYKVELLIFSQQGSDNLKDETWPTIDTLPERRSRSLKYNQQGQQNGYFTRLPKSALDMSNKQASLRRSPEYRVLFHEAWVQPVGNKRNQHRIRVNGGEILDNGLYELDGYISVERVRYLHFRTELFHSRQLSAAESRLLAPVTPTITPDSSETPADAASNETDSMNGNRYLTQTSVPDFLTVTMDSARRMRSKELHYLDHPLFGALIQITPIEK